MEFRKNLYLIFKEAVNNAIKYSQADEIMVFIALKGNRLEVKIADNGVGFNQDDAMNRRSVLGGNGLRGMNIRARQINAELRINSRVGNGTSLTLLASL
jgi:signal transduction histidine kinase